MVALINILANQPPWVWLVFGIIVFFISHFSIPSVKRKIPNWPETERTRNHLSLALNLAVIAGGLAISVYGIHITVREGAGKMSANEYQYLVDQVTTWVYLYFGLVWTLAGIALGGLIWLVKQLIWGKLGKKQQGDRQDTETTISNKELASLKEKIGQLKETKDKLDDFFKNLNR